jgi:ribonuclease HI
MELMAAIVALESMKRPCAVSLHTDSQYLMKGSPSGGAAGRRAAGKPPPRSR